MFKRPYSNGNIFKLFLLLLPLFTKAQLNNLQFTSFSENRNVGVKYPKDILIDKNYKYWIASLSGLVEYDGSKLKVHHMPFYQNGTLGSDYIDRIILENDSTIWINHISGVAKFNLNTKKYELIKIPQVPPTTYFNFIYNYKDSDGKLFFISNELKVSYYDKNTNCIKSSDEFNHDSLSFVFKITEIEGKNYLLHTRKGFYIYNKVQKKFLQKTEVPFNYQWIFYPDFRNGVNDYVTIGNDHYVSTYIKDKKQNIILKYNSITKAVTLLSVQSNRGRLLFKDSFNRLWMYGFGDIAELYDPQTNKLVKIKNTVNPNNPSEYTLCYKVFEDHENNIWLCTNTGLLTFNLYQNDFEIISKNLPPNIFGEIEQVNKDVLWFGSVYNGIHEYNYNTKKIKNYNFSKETGSSDYNDIWQLYKDNQQTNIWIIHTKGKISRYNISEEKFYHYNDTIFERGQVSISEDKNGTIFLATETGKLIEYNRSTDRFNTVLRINQLKGINPEIEVNDIVFIDNENFVVGTSGDGIIKINYKTNTIIKNNVGSDSTSVRSNIINILKKFDDEFIFAGTTNGISAYNIKTGLIENFCYKEDFNLGFVYDITKDDKGNIIFIGANDLYLMNWKTKEIIDLGEKSNIFRTSCTNVYYSKAFNKLYVLTEESIYEVTLNHKLTKPKIKPVIYSLDTYGKTYAIMNNADVYLDKNSSSFRVNFGSSTYKFKDDLEYFYNFDNEGWQPIAAREISFSNIAGGDHVFKLKAVFKGNRSIYSEKVLNIHISKKFHETIWFYLLIIIVALSVLYLIYRVRLNQLLSIERVRLELSRDLHDDMGSTLSTINILSTMALRKIDQDTSATKDYLRKTSKYCLKMMDSMDDIVWSLNPANDKMKQIIYRMREFASTLLESRNIKFIFDIDEKVNDFVLHMAIRRDFFLIFKEAVNNAAKYSQCTQVKVELEVIANNLVLTISDDGVGIDKSLIKDGNGLNNMRKRTELLKGQLVIESENKAGTTITLTINIKYL